MFFRRIIRLFRRIYGCAFRTVLRVTERILHRHRFSRNAERFFRKIEVHSSSRLSSFVAHTGAFLLPPPSVRVVGKVSVAGGESEFGRTYCPWQYQRSFSSDSRGWKSDFNMEEILWVNSIFSFESWNQSYFHWHRNFLTHVVTLQDLGFPGVRVIVSDDLPDYKAESLLGLGICREDIVPWSTLEGPGVENMVFLTNVDRQSPPYPEDLVRPSAVRLLSSKILEASPLGRSQEKSKLYVKRGSGVKRKVLNEPEILEFLRSEGFQIVDPGKMSFWEQVSLFANASDVIAPHGGALTNVIFSERPNLLEFAPSGHGARPDFFQFVDALEGCYTMCIVPSENEENDMRIPLEVVRWWVAQRQTTRNLVFTFEAFK